MRNKHEIVQGDKSLRLNLYIVVASYLLLVILVEPVIDFFLLNIIEQNNPSSIALINKLKLVISGFIYVTLGLIPAFYASWFGYRIVASSKLPPVLLSGKIRFPFTVTIIKGKPAKMFGILIVTVSLVIIAQLVLYLIKVLFL